MMFSLGSMVRLLAVLALGSTMLAVGISRLDPRLPERRVARPVTEYNINDYLLDVDAHRSRWINAETGAMVAVGDDSDDFLEAASCSPWVDEAGRRQVVGRWSNRSGDGPETICHAFGLARYSFPEMRVIDQVTTDLVPTAPPIWLPGSRARVVFPAGDGQIYRHDFEGPVPGEPAPGTASEPRPLTWGCPRPGMGEVYISQVVQSEDPRMGGRLVATLRLLEPGQLKSRSKRLSRTQLWWLELDAAATQIVAAAPLIDHDRATLKPDTFNEQSPVLIGLPDGTLGLAYALMVDGQPGWSARLGRLGADPGGRPTPVLESQTWTVAPRCLGGPLACSADGKWLNVLIGAADSGESVGRFATLGPDAPARPR